LFQADGSIAQIGTPYLLTMKAVNCSTGGTLTSTEAQASDKNHVLDALGRTALEMRNKLGESLGTVQKFDTPLEEATTPSLEALKAFSAGRQANSGPIAIPFLKRAVELDANFAVAYAWLGSGIPRLESPAPLPGTHEKHTNCASTQASLRGISYRRSITKRFRGTSKKPNNPATFGYKPIPVPRFRTLTCQAQSTRRLVDTMERLQKPKRQFV